MIISYFELQGLLKTISDNRVGVDTRHIKELRNAVVLEMRNRWLEQPGLENFIREFRLISNMAKSYPEVHTFQYDYQNRLYELLTALGLT